MNARILTKGLLLGGPSHLYQITFEGKPPETIYTPDFFWVGETFRGDIGTIDGKMYTNVYKATTETKLTRDFIIYEYAGRK